MPIGLVAPLHLVTCHRVASLPCIINEQEYNEIKAVEAAFQFRIELEADEILDISHGGGWPSWQKSYVPSNLTSQRYSEPASTYPVLALTGTFQFPPDPTLMPGARLATRDNL